MGKSFGKKEGMKLRWLVRLKKKELVKFSAVIRLNTLQVTYPKCNLSNRIFSPCTNVSPQGTCHIEFPQVFPQMRELNRKFAHKRLMLNSKTWRLRLVCAQCKRILNELFSREVQPRTDIVYKACRKWHVINSPSLN